MKLFEKAYAKLNLNLFVLFKRDDGFHELKSHVIPLNIYDELTIEKSNKNLVDSNIKIKDNIVLKTIELFQKTYNINDKVKIYIDKNIPLGSGLGGGSADAAATLRILNKFYGLNKPLKELEVLANQLGSDVLFCLYNKPAIISGRGDKIDFINSQFASEIAIITFDFEILTKDVFESHHIIDREFKNIDYQNEFYNDLLPTLLSINKDFAGAYYKLSNIFDNIYMTGSGPTLFIINPSSEDKVELKNINQPSMRIKNIKIAYTNI